jgi:hypothetical protein
VRGQCHSPANFYPGKDPVPIVQEVGWALGPVWTGAENLASTGIRSSDRDVVHMVIHVVVCGRGACWSAMLVRCTVEACGAVPKKTDAGVWKKLTENFLSPLT